MPGTRATQEGPFWKKVLRDRLVGKKIVANVLVLLRRRRLGSQETKRRSNGTGLKGTQRGKEVSEQKKTFSKKSRKRELLSFISVQVVNAVYSYVFGITDSSYGKR